MKASLFEGHGLGLDGGRHLSHFLHENEVVEVAKETIFLVDVKLPVAGGGDLDLLLSGHVGIVHDVLQSGREGEQHSVELGQIHGP